MHQHLSSSSRLGASPLFAGFTLWSFSVIAQALPATAEPLAPVTVEAEGLAPFLLDMSLNEVRGRARDEARRNAIEQAVGVFLRGLSLMKNSQITDELVTAIARGVIEDEQWMDERIEELKEEKRPGLPMAVYHTQVKAAVRPVRVERRGDFDVRASLNKDVFQEGEEALIKIRATQPAHLYMFSVTQDGSVTVLMPNHYVRRNLVSPDQDIIFPNETLRSLGIKLRVMLGPGVKKATEYIKVIATRKPIEFFTEVGQDGVFHTFSGAEQGMIQDVVKRLALLDDQDWTETTLPYEVRK